MLPLSSAICAFARLVLPDNSSGFMCSCYHAGANRRTKRNAYLAIGLFGNQNKTPGRVRGLSTRVIVRNRGKAMRKDAGDPSRSTPDSESGRKKKYNAPQFTRLTPEEAKATLTARGLPDSPVVRQLLEWVAELEKRADKK